jgi:hypothetical protein
MLKFRGYPRANSARKETRPPRKVESRKSGRGSEKGRCVEVIRAGVPQGTVHLPVDSRDGRSGWNSQLRCSRVPPRLPHRFDAWDVRRLGNETEGRVLGCLAPSASCVQRLDDSRTSAIRITSRSSLRSSSVREPRDPGKGVIEVQSQSGHAPPKPRGDDGHEPKQGEKRTKRKKKRADARRLRPKPCHQRSAETRLCACPGEG